MRWREGDADFLKRGGGGDGRPVRARAGSCLGAAVMLALSGCGYAPDVDMGANQSLVEIGENALERAEALDNEGLIADANISYRRALWAFRYHEQLTGEEPLLLEDALKGVERTTLRRR